VHHALSVPDNGYVEIELWEDSSNHCGSVSLDTNCASRRAFSVLNWELVLCPTFQEDMQKDGVLQLMQADPFLYPRTNGAAKGHPQNNA